MKGGPIRAAFFYRLSIERRSHQRRERRTFTSHSSGPEGQPNKNLIETIIKTLDPDRPEASAIQAAAKVILDGGLVAFPTETVYGLGADAMNERAVRRIFEAKGRPADNPVIVHVSSREMLARVVVEITPAARRLISTFWPGPLTLVLERRPELAGSVSAGLSTVAVRMPANTIALELIKAADTPIAAPSANASGRPSPTKAEHVAEDLSGQIEMLLDAGPTQIGIESTVLDLTSDPPAILRPGWITREMISGVIGSLSAAEGEALAHSPGTRYQHYNPKARVILVERDARRSAIDVVRDFKSEMKVGFIGYSQLEPDLKEVEYISIEDDAEKYARAIYAALRSLDEKKAAIIVVEGIADAGGGDAVMDRLRRAATTIISA